MLEGVAANPTAFDYVGIFSQASRIDSTLDARLTALRDGKPKLVYVTVGTDDFLLENSRALVERMKKVGLTPTYHETPGAHTFFVWRQYLSDFAPQLFR